MSERRDQLGRRAPQRCLRREVLAAVRWGASPQPFGSLPTPAAEAADIALRTAQRLDKLLRAQRRPLLRDEYSDPEPPARKLEHPALAAC